MGGGPESRCVGRVCGADGAVSLFNCIKTSAQRDLLKHRINKPMSLQDNKLELITKYRKVYSEFIESIDFDLSQQSDK